MGTKIEWTEVTWNPITGCTKISEGCKNCYAEKMSKRLAGRFGYPDDDPFRVTIQADKFTKPKNWKKPRMVFVCSMSDLFHEAIDFTIIDMLFGIMHDCSHHTFQVLTKRPERMLEYFNSRGHILPNVWLGVTAENQDEANKRIPILLQIPAAIRFVSCEPLLGPIDLKQVIAAKLRNWILNNETQYGLDWVICGGESGHNARPMHPNWARSLRDQCQEADVPFFFKQWGELLPGCQVNNIKQVGRNSVQFRSPHNPNKMNTYYKIGKTKAGRLLDGKEWNEWPV